eukprot:12071793-Prorocentrum_lima.AAC.1
MFKLVRAEEFAGAPGCDRCAAQPARERARSRSCLPAWSTSTGWQASRGGASATFVLARELLPAA